MESLESLDNEGVPREERDRGAEKKRSRRPKKPRRREIVDPDVLPDLTPEDELRAMLGYKETSTGKMQPYMYREDFCACCGTLFVSDFIISPTGRSWEK